MQVATEDDLLTMLASLDRRIFDSRDFVVVVFDERGDELIERLRASMQTVQ